jgi:hypothetical protein
MIKVRNQRPAVSKETWSDKKAMSTRIRSHMVPATQRSLALAFTVAGLLLPWHAGAVGSWIPLSSTPPGGGRAHHMLLLSDATVMVQQADSPSWFRLMPGSTGGYTNGIWTNDILSMNYGRRFYASDVLQDGRVFVAGGEYPTNGSQQTVSEVYNPSNNLWTTNADTLGVIFKDSESVVLPYGTVLAHPVGSGTNSPNTTMIYSPVSDTWNVGPTNQHGQGEATWVKLPDDSILGVDRNTLNSERYIPSLNTWIPDADLPVALYANGETGAALLLPDKRAFFLGASGHTALYTPTGTTNNGSWAPGPDIPDGRFADDAPAAMMSNGKILCVVGTNNPNGGSGGSAWFYEYDYSIGTTGAFTKTSCPTNAVAGSFFTSATFNLSMLDLPDGTVLLSFDGDTTGQLYVYQPDGTPVASGKPTINSIGWNKDGSLHLVGKLFNGISQGSSFGDDAQEASNYPIVRFTDGGGTVSYGRTYNWSSTSVMTGDRIVTTEATLPSFIHDAQAKYSLAVIANGIASDDITFYGPVWVDFNYKGASEIGTYQNPYKTLTGGVSAVTSGGSIAFKANIQPSLSHETMTISKPINLVAVGGPATIGQ